MKKIYNRQNKEFIVCEEENSNVLNFLYNTVVGRLLLKILTCKFIAVLYSSYMKSRFSKHKIQKFINKYNIDLSKYKTKKFNNFNDFFVREKEQISFDKKDTHFISVADSKLLMYEISSKTKLKIKNSIYSVEELIKNKKISDKYKDGMCLVFRLSLNDYHRYCYVDDGEQAENIKISGKLHSVRPIAYSKYKVFCENSREWTIMNTKNFGEIVQIEVGAMQIGKIKNHNQNIKFIRGQEKGYFEYGGSTIILLIEKDKIKIDDDILENSKKEIETIVKIGEKIGVKSEEK